MKQIQWVLAMLLVLVAQRVFADSIPTFNITQTKIFITWGGDNVGFSLIGPGTEITGSGGFLCQSTFCGGPPAFSGIDPFPPGSTLAGGGGEFGDIYLSSLGVVKVGGQDFDSGSSFVGLALSLNFDITFPSTPTGASFTNCSSGGETPGFVGGSGIPLSGSPEQFILVMPAGGQFCSTWEYSPVFDPRVSAGYWFSEGTFRAGTAGIVPEPTTLSLFAVGLVGLAMRRKAVAALHSS